MARPTRIRATPQALIELAWTILDVFLRMKVVTDRFTAAEGQSTPRLSVLLELLRGGPRTVAQIARARRVARQGVQRLADELGRDGLVRFLPNPAHRRSPLLHLTAAGRRVARKLAAYQNAIARDLAGSFGAAEVERATALLRGFGNLIDAAAGPASLPSRIHP